MNTNQLLLIISFAAPRPAETLAPIRPSAEKQRLRCRYGSGLDSVEVTKFFSWKPRAFFVFDYRVAEISGIYGEFVQHITIKPIAPNA